MDAIGELSTLDAAVVLAIALSVAPTNLEQALCDGGSGAPIFTALTHLNLQDIGLLTFLPVVASSVNADTPRTCLAGILHLDLRDNSIAYPPGVVAPFDKILAPALETLLVGGTRIVRLPAEMNLGLKELDISRSVLGSIVDLSAYALVGL